MKAAQRKALGDVLSRATDVRGGAHVPARAAALRELGEMLKGAPRGRPRDDELRSIAIEYYTARIRDRLSHAAAVKVVLSPRTDALFPHGARRPRSAESLKRMLRLQRDYALVYMDIIDSFGATSEQIAAFRRELIDRSLPKRARTRK